VEEANASPQPTTQRPTFVVLVVRTVRRAVVVVVVVMVRLKMVRALRIPPLKVKVKRVVVLTLRAVLK
jgi:hypothetical protein